MTAPAPDDAALERLLAELEWQPIATAPKDGRAIRIRHEDWPDAELGFAWYKDGWYYAEWPHADAAFTHWSPAEIPPRAADIVRTALPALIERARMAERLGNSLDAALQWHRAARDGHQPVGSGAEQIAMLDAALADARSAGLLETAKEGSDVG
jgi:hypothetical protein